ncbi:MAG: choice-of-anchor D domain-containing protein, partial [Candidatus Kapaibacteriota bacterium]
PNDTIVGIRTEWGTARLCFWSIGFEAFAGDIPRGYQLARAMRWLKGNIAPDGAAYDIDPNIVDFGEVQPGTSDTIRVTITSTGKLDLQIDEIDFWENPDIVFEIVSGKLTKPLKLTRGQTHSFTVKFTPKDKISYKGSISIKTNALFNEYYYLDVWGYGGGIEAIGPILETNLPENKIDFGKVKKPSSKILQLILKNVGDKTLEISEFEIDTTYEDYQRFDFAQVLQVPIYIEPNDSVIIKVRFSAATQEERIYRGRIRVQTNAKNNNLFFIELQGEVEGLVSVENTSDDFLEVVNDALSKNLLIQFKPRANTYYSKINFINELGQIVFTKDCNLELNQNTLITVPYSSIPSGFYLLQIQTFDQTFAKPLVLIR